MANEKLIKQCTIGAAAFATALVIGKVSDARDKKQKNQILSDELNRLHEIQAVEIQKNGKTSEETMRQLDSAMKKIKF